MTFFKFLWYADWLVLFIALYFFMTGISTATPGSGFGKAWAVLLSALGGVLFVSWWLSRHGQNGLATAIAAIPAGLGAMYLLFILVMTLGGGRWN